jgi:hypothetical protein
MGFFASFAKIGKMAESISGFPVLYRCLHVFRRLLQVRYLLLAAYFAHGNA